MSLLLRAISRVWAPHRPRERNCAYFFCRDLRPRLPPMGVWLQGALEDNVFRAGCTQGGVAAGWVRSATHRLASRFSGGGGHRGGQRRQRYAQRGMLGPTRGVRARSVSQSELSLAFLRNKNIQGFPQISNILTVVHEEPCLVTSGCLT